MIIIIGCGTLGSRVARLLKGEQLTLIDHDDVQPRNIPHQLYEEKYLGHPKAGVLGKLVSAKTHLVFLDHTNIDLLKEAEVVVDCTDNLLTRELLGAYCYKEGIPLVHGAAAGERGIAALFDGKPCMASLYAGKVSVDTCRSADIDIAIADTVAQKQAELAKKAREGHGHDGVYIITKTRTSIVRLSENTHAACTKELPRVQWYITYCTQASCMSAKRTAPIEIETGTKEIDGVQLEVLAGGEIHFFTDEEADVLKSVAEKVYSQS